MDFFRKYIFVILTVLGILFLTFQVAIWNSNPFSGVIDTSSARTIGGDYRSYYFTSKHFIAGDNIYFSSQQSIKFDQEQVDTFVYPPLMAVLFVPLGLLPFFGSYLFFITLSILLFLLSVYFLSRKLPNSNSFLWLSIVAFFSSPIIILHFDRGQTDIVILSLLVASLWLFLKKKSVLSGVLVGVVASLKVTPLIFLPYFFIRDRKAFWSSVITIAVVFACFRINIWADFWERFRGFAGSVSSGNMSNSLFGVFYNKNFFDYYSYDAALLVYLCVVALVLITTFFFIYKNKIPSKFVLLEYGIMTTFMMILPPVSWVYNGVHSLFLLATYWSVRFNGSLNKWTYFFFDILVYLLLSQPLLSPLVRNFSIYHIFSLRPIIYLCFVALFIYLIHKEKINEYIVKLKLSKFYSNSFLRFCVVGFVGTASNLLVFYLISKFFNINIAAISAFAFAVTQNYLLNHSWSFRLHDTGKPTIKSYSRYIFVNLFGLALNLLILNLLVRIGFNALIAQAVGVVAGMFFNYAGSYLFVFARKVKVAI